MHRINYRAFNAFRTTIIGTLKNKSTVSIGDVEKAIFEVKHPELVPVKYCK